MKLCGSLVFLGLITGLIFGCTQTKSEQPFYFTWDKITLDFNGPKTSELDQVNPFTDYKMTVEFISPSNERLVVPGFYAADGNSGETGATHGNIWRVIFSPNEVGTWRYEVSFETGDFAAINDQATRKSAGFFDRAVGVFYVKNRATPTLGKKEDNLSRRSFSYQGKLAYTGEHYLQHMGSKNYFLKGGANSPEVFLGFSEFDQTDTDRNYKAHESDWREGDPLWQGKKGKGIVGVLNYLARKNNNALYFLLMNSEGDGKQVWPWVSEKNITRYDVSKLDQWGKVFDHMNDIGIMAHFVLTETENESFFEWEETQTTGGFADTRKLYYREMVARFGYLLGVTWNIGEENGWVDYTGDDAHKKANTTGQRIESAKYLRGLTHYADPIVIHNGPDEDYHIFDKPNDNILGVPYYTGPSLQGNYWKKNVYKDVRRFRQASSDAGHKWVVSMDEPYSERAMNVALWRKENVWATFMAGGAGIELYLGGGLDLSQQNLREFDAHYRATGIALAFFNTNVPFWRLKPLDSADTNIRELADDSYRLVYFKTAKPTTLKIKAERVTLQWFHPKSDTLWPVENVSLVGPELIATPPNSKTDNAEDDWALIVKTIL